MSPSFDRAIEAKASASQRAKRTEREPARVKFEADHQIAESIAIQAQALRTNGGQDNLQLQAVDRWVGKLPTYMGASAPLPFPNIDK
jgi:hypothetical protein